MLHISLLFLVCVLFFGGPLALVELDKQLHEEILVLEGSEESSILEGNYNRVSFAEVEKLAGGDGSGRVQR